MSAKDEIKNLHDTLTRNEHTFKQQANVEWKNEIAPYINALAADKELARKYREVFDSVQAKSKLQLDLIQYLRDRMEKK